MEPLKLCDPSGETIFYSLLREGSDFVTLSKNFIDLVSRRNWLSKPPCGNILYFKEKCLAECACVLWYQLLTPVTL